MFSNLLTTERQSKIYASGLLSILVLGSLSLLALLLLACWGVVELTNILFCSTLGTIQEACILWSNVGSIPQAIMLGLVALFLVRKKVLKWI